MRLAQTPPRQVYAGLSRIETYSSRWQSLRKELTRRHAPNAIRATHPASFTGLVGNYCRYGHTHPTRNTLTRTKDIGPLRAVDFPRHGSVYRSESIQLSKNFTSQLNGRGLEPLHGVAESNGNTVQSMACRAIPCGVGSPLILPSTKDRFLWFQTTVVAFPHKFL